MAKSAEELRDDAAKLQAKAKTLLRLAEELERAEELTLLRQIKKAGKLGEVQALLSGGKKDEKVEIDKRVGVKNSESQVDEA
jgi:hypothetical protein